MNSHIQKSAPQIYERFLQITALGTFILGIIFGLETTAYLVSDRLGEVLHEAADMLAILVVVIVLPFFLHFLWYRFSKSAACSRPEGFVIEMYKKASVNTFTFLFLLLIGLNNAEGRLLSHLPPAFFLDLILAAALIFFSGAFFLSLRAPDGDADDFDGLGDV